VSYSILGGGDPIFNHGDRWAAEEARELQIKFDDHHLSDGRVLCYWCEMPFDPETMEDYESDGFTWKVCQSDSGLRLYHA